MAQKALARVTALVDESAEETTEQVEEQTEASVQIWREHALSTDSIFYGEDELKRAGWFLRLEVTGLFPRRCGPFGDRDEAIRVLEWFLSMIVPGDLCEVQNELTPLYLVEGIPRLTALPVEDHAWEGHA